MDDPRRGGGGSILPAIAVFCSCFETLLGKRGYSRGPARGRHWDGREISRPAVFVRRRSASNFAEPQSPLAWHRTVLYGTGQAAVYGFGRGRPGRVSDLSAEGGGEHPLSKSQRAGALPSLRVDLEDSPSLLAVRSDDRDGQDTVVQ